MTYRSGHAAALATYGMKRADENEATKDWSDFGAGASAVGARTVAVKGLSRAGAAMREDSPVTPGRYETIRKGMGSDAKLKYHKEKDNAWYLDGKVYLKPRDSDATIAHELGHAVNDEVIKSLPALLRAPTRALQYTSNAYTNLGLPIIPTYLAASQEEPNYKPGLWNLGLMAPRLLDETLASAHGLRYLVNTHGLGEGLRRGASMLPYWGTYAATAAAPLAVTAARKWWRGRQSQQEGLPAPVES